MSIPLRKASKGKQLNSLTANFLDKWFSTDFVTMVDIPVSTQKSLLVFSIETELRKREEYKSLSQDSYLELIKIVSSTLGTLESKPLQKVLKTAGLDFSDEKVVTLVNEMKREVSKQITGAGIASILVQDVLSAQQAGVDKPSDVNIRSIIDLIGRIQDAYGEFASSSPLSTIGEQLTSGFRDSKPLGHINQLWKTFHRHKSATVKARLTYALDKLYEHTFDRSIVDMDTEISGMHYHIKDIHGIKDLKYRQVVCMYFTSLRSLMGVSAGEAPTSTKLSDLLDNFLLNIPDQLPVLPKDLACTKEEMKEVQEVFGRLWLMNVYRMILLSDEGTLAHQIKNVMEERKYNRDEAWDTLIKDGIICMSVAWEAFLRTSAMFRDWAKDEDIYFAQDTDLPYNVKLKLNKFVFEVVSGYNTFKPMTHPRFLCSPAHIINYVESTKGVNNVQFFVKDRDINWNRTTPIMGTDLVRTILFKNKKLTGSDLDVDLEIERPLLPMAGDIKPLYGLTVPRPSVYGGDVSTALLGIRAVEDIASSTSIPGEILRQSQFVFIENVVDLANQFSIPEEVAEMIFKQPGLYVSLARQGVLFLTWDFETAPVVEFSHKDTSRDYVPFTSRYPYLLMYTNRLPNIYKTPGIVDPDKQVKKVKDPKDPEKKTESVDPKDPEKKDPKDPVDPQ